jgi:hypothetical protein
MENIIIQYLEHPKLHEPILIEGLPGIGNVGKLAAEHLIDEIGAIKFADIYSKYFPPQVFVDDRGVIKLVENELYYKKADNRLKDDLIILVGDFQGVASEGQYELSDEIIKVARNFNTKRIYTLGGYGVGRSVDRPRVFGAATNIALVKEMKKYGVIFSRSEPSGGIVGASGLLLGLGKLYNIQSVCLMGETSGYFADPKSAESVLRVLIKVLDIEIDFSRLESKAVQIEQIESKLRELEMQLTSEKREDLGYFG